MAPGGALPIGPFDLAVSLDAPGRTARWEEHLGALARLARMAVVVLTRNAERIGGPAGPTATALAGVLWQLGRVREHAYLAGPRILGRGEVVQAPAGTLVRRLAQLHAFVVDTAPRTPQARRRLAQVG